MKQLSLILLFVVSGLPIAAQSTGNISTLNLLNGVALKGYDVTSYFFGKPVKGEEKFRSVYEGAIYWFQNTQNLHMFEEDPSQYLPQYGGYCAYAMGASGELVDVSPQAYKLKDGKLYFFYKSYLNNTLRKWNKDEFNLLQMADTNWKYY